ncbi:hypothetical protein [Flavobacterium ardleyense]|uniref:hypothetical protein n=1 Tax=Flavobacterium ardleyense TaxID=2038737 RepID=UPI00298C98F3|nr:hypothetical protein [Flavobacterium ardleyense]
MFEPKNILNKISYLQYPFMLISGYYIVQPYIVGFDTIWENYNLALLFMGIAISLSTLQDTTKMQNEMSRKIWEDPKKGKRMLIALALLAFGCIAIGIFGASVSTNKALKELSYGIIVLGIGLIGMLNTAMDLFDNHRLDKKATPSNEKAFIQEPDI